MKTPVYVTTKFRLHKQFIPYYYGMILGKPAPDEETEVLLTVEDLQMFVSTVFSDSEDSTEPAKLVVNEWGVYVGGFQVAARLALEDEGNESDE